MHKIGQIFGCLIPVIVLGALVIFLAGCESQEKAKVEELKAATRSIVEEAYNKGNLDVLDDFYTTDFVYHMPPYPDFEGLEAYKQYITDLRIGYPDIELTIDDLIGEGDIGAMRWTFRGTQTGESPTLGIPPTGKQVTFTGCAVSHFVDGKIVETWNIVDYLGLLQKLGFKIIPPPK